MTLTHLAGHNFLQNCSLLVAYVDTSGRPYRQLVLLSTQLLPTPMQPILAEGSAVGTEGSAVVQIFTWQAVIGKKLPLPLFCPFEAAVTSFDAAGIKRMGIKHTGVMGIKRMVV